MLSEAITYLSYRLSVLEISFFTVIDGFVIFRKTNTVEYHCNIDVFGSVCWCRNGRSSVWLKYANLYGAQIHNRRSFA